MDSLRLKNFRVVVLVLLDQPTPAGDAEGGSFVPPMIGFHRCLGVLAESYSEAAGFVEEFVARSAVEEPLLAGSLKEMEMDVQSGMPETDPDVTYLQALDQPGVYFATGLAFFDRLEEGEPN